MNVNILKTRKDPKGGDIIIDMQVTVPKSVPVALLAAAFRDIALAFPPAVDAWKQLPRISYRPQEPKS